RLHLGSDDDCGLLARHGYCVASRLPTLRTLSGQREFKIENCKLKTDGRQLGIGNRPCSYRTWPFTTCNLQFAIVLFIGILFASGCSLSTKPDAPDDHLSPVSDFSLNERSGQVVRKADLLGKVWVAAFIFTRCAGPCAQVSGTMARLQQDLADSNDVVLVSFSVDPEYDSPKVLSEYAKTYRADPKRWLFLTGKPDDVYRLIREGFKLTAQQNEGAERTAGKEVMHDTRLAVVDRRGEIRGYYQATDPEAIVPLEQKIAALIREQP